MYEITKQDKVLFVDDEPNVLKSIKRSLHEAKFEVLTTWSPEKAIEIMRENNIAVLVTDLKMPEMSGIDLIKHVSEHNPEVVKIVLSAYYQMSTVLSVMKQGEIFYYFTKPWKMEDDFLPTLNRAIKHYKEMTEIRRASEQSTQQIADLRQELKSIRSLYKQLKQVNQANLGLIKYTYESYVRAIKQLNDIIASAANQTGTCSANSLSQLRNDAVASIKNIQKVMEKVG